MITVICVYNDEKILNEYLLKSLEPQTAKFELIKLDNTKGEYDCAARALNCSASKARGEYLMFVHQDVDLSSNSWLEEAEKIVDSIPDLGIGGVAGVSEDGSTHKDRKRNIIKHGYPPQEIIAVPIEKAQRVQTLDECLMIIPKAVFERFRFDEKTCSDWHLYGADYCLGVRKLGLYAYVMPMFIYHRSAGYSMAPAYYRTLKKLLYKYKNETKYIYKPGKAWATFYPLFLQRTMLAFISALRWILIKIGARYLWRKSGLKSLWFKIRSIGK